MADEGMVFISLSYEGSGLSDSSVVVRQALYPASPAQHFSRRSPVRKEDSGQINLVLEKSGTTPMTLKVFHFICGTEGHNYTIEKKK